MRNKILEIVVFLIDYMREKGAKQTTTEEISVKLSEMGYTDDEIDTAYDWFVEQFSSENEPEYSSFPKRSGSMRILTDTERLLISPDAYGFLMKLLNGGVIDDEQLETVIDRVISLSGDPLTLDQIKEIASSVIERCERVRP